MAVRIYPTNGFGSFCASATSDEDSDGTLATERRVNIALQEANEDTFVERLLNGLDAYPGYYAQMRPLNIAGGIAIDLSAPAPVDPVKLARRIHRGEWVVDLRPRREFAAQHLAGTINVELDDGFSIYLAWLLPWGMPLTLLADHADSIAEAQRQFVRIGIDRPAGAATGDLASWSPDADRLTYDMVSFSDLANDNVDATILDVRRAGEFTVEHLNGATSIPLHELLDRLDDVPDGALHVHCQTGLRAAIAASLLNRAGQHVVLIDDHFDNAADSGLGLRPSG